IPPIDLEVKALAAIREGVSKNSANERLLVEWQTRWQDSPKGRWTQHLIPNVAAWLGCKHKELHYHLTQFLTNHGCFRGYLARFQHADTPQCVYCEDE
ncbi:hypothetical protein KR018_000270, partial [Drosophila ironensis]